MSETPKNIEPGKSVWQSQTLDAPRVTLEFVRHHIETLNADFRKQLHLMYWSMAAFVLAGIMLALTKASTLDPKSIGLVLGLIGGAYVIVQVRRRGEELRASGDEGISSTLEAYRNELRRRRDYYLHSWRWSLWPMIPSILVLVVGSIVFDAKGRPATHHVAMVACSVLVIAIAIWEHRRKGRELQRELDAFETLVK